LSHVSPAAMAAGPRDRLQACFHIGRRAESSTSGHGHVAEAD